MTNLSSQQQQALQQRYTHRQKIPPAPKNDFLSKSSSQKRPHLLRATDSSDNQGLRETESPCYYYDYYKDETTLESTNAVSVYGNPLWADDRKLCGVQGNSEIPAEHDDLLYDSHQKCTPLTDDELEAPSMRMQRNQTILLSSDSSDGEDASPRRSKMQNPSFWRADVENNDSRSTSQNSSNFDFNSVCEISNTYEQQTVMQGNSRTCPTRRPIWPDNRLVMSEHLEQSIPELSPQSLTTRTKGMPSSMIPTETFECRANLKEGKPEQNDQALHNPGASHGDNNAQHRFKQFDLALFDGKNVFANININNRQSMLWSHGKFSRDMNMLSQQEEDYLHQNSDLLASFEVQDYRKKRDVKEMAFAEGTSEHIANDSEGNLLLEPSNVSKNEDVASELVHVNKLDKNENGQGKEMGHFYGTSSCLTDSEDSTIHRPQESQEQLSNFSNERILWEQKKLSEMSNFNAFKESETQRLRKERTNLEKQSKMLAQLPSKKERNEIEQLKETISDLISEHSKKDSMQNLTINRLRRNITDLMEQINALQEEVRRYERFIHMELDANENSKRKGNISKMLESKNLQSHNSEQDHNKQFKDEKSQFLDSNFISAG